MKTSTVSTLETSNQKVKAKHPASETVNYINLNNSWKT